MKRQLASVAVAALLLLAAVSGGVVAQDDEEDSLFEQFTGVETSSAEDSGLLDGVGATIDTAGKYIDRTVYGVSSMLSDRTDAERAQDYATNTTEVFNANNETLTNYTDSRVGNVTGSEWDTIAVEFQVGDATATRYLVTDYENGNFTNGAMVNDTNRTVDKTLVLEDYAAKSAADELEYFTTEYAAENRDVDLALLSRMQAHADNIDLPEGVRN